jgi:glucokinase
MKNILAADIGGTNSRFAHFRVEEGEPLTLRETKWLGTKDVQSFPELIERLRSSDFPLSPEDADMAVMAVAGPVERGTYSNPPLISWDVDLSESGKRFGLEDALLINDFVAQAYACRSPVGERARSMLSGASDPEGAVAVLGAGTGLGKAALVADARGGFVAVPSEGGHTNFPFMGKRERSYEEFLLRETGDAYMTGNVVVSGRGLSLLHQFLTGEALPPDEVTARFTEDSETLRWAARFYARAARNYALETIATGGVYVAGGVAAKNPRLLTHQAFAEEFRSNPKHARLLERMPVLLITDEQSGLWGAAFLGQLVLARRRQP